MPDGQASSPRGNRSVIINADDFGLSPEVNAAVLRAHREGVLTSTSLMVGEEGAVEAARAARDFPGLDVGLHVVVCMGRSAIGAAAIAPLVDSAGRFPDSPVLAGMRYFFNRGLREKLRAECRAQIERHLELVGYLNHIDGHLNFHVHPVLADILVELAAEYKVPCIRLPRESVVTTLALARDHTGRKLVESVIFRNLSRRARRLALAHGIRSTDWLFGLHQTGHMSEAYVLGLIERLRAGVTEIYFHPAMDVGVIPPALSAQREVEILTSPRVRQALEAHGVGLTTYRELARS